MPMIYTKTPLGQQAFKERSSALSGKLRTVFLMFDGVRDRASVLASTAAMGVTEAEIDALVSAGLIAPLEGGVTMATAGQAAEDSERAQASAVIAAMSPQERFVEAAHIATSLTSKLGLRGFRLNLSVETAGTLDDLRALLPKIEDAVGRDASYSLRRILRD